MSGSTVCPDCGGVAKWDDCTTCGGALVVTDRQDEGGGVMGEIKPFADAQIGDEAYTWENEHGHWGEPYVFETEDPLTLGVCNPGERITRKRWRLVAVDEIVVGVEGPRIVRTREVET